MLDVVQKKILDSEPFRKLGVRAVLLSGSESFACRGIHGSLMAFLAAGLFKKRRGAILLVVPDEDRAEKLRDDCVMLLGENAVRWFGRGVAHKAKLLDMSGPIARIETLKALSDGERIVVVSSAAAFAHSAPSPKQFAEGKIVVSVQGEHPFKMLTSKLEAIGFERKDFVEEYGDFAVRGGIVDIFPYVGENPLRVEFWGDSIESIREFDALSQRSIRSLQSATIVANPDLDFADDKGGDTAGSRKALSSILDYLKDDALVFLHEPALIEGEFRELEKEGTPGLLDWPVLAERLSGFPRIIHSSMELPRDGGLNPALDFLSLPQPPTNGSIKFLVQHIRELEGNGFEVSIACDTGDESRRIRELIDEELTVQEPAELTDTPGESDVPAPAKLRYTLVEETVHSGFVYEPGKVALFTEHEIFSRLRRRGGQKKARFKGFTQKELVQLKRRDFVVHIDYGIGEFAGLQKIKVRGVEQEVMKILYEGNDAIYVNLNFINRVQKYSSQEGHVPKITSLGSPDWERLKSRARKKIKDIARDLIKLYARRKHDQGFAFGSDTHWQKEMEASFMYEDTPDQAAATLDVKKDMEQSFPMDRLICGDVGFGKTEVAVRAAFKAVLNGKQAAVLVPTTILAQQHFNTFLDRIGRYGVKVESLSRFKSSKDQKRILESLKDSQLDVIIGTHRLLSKDVVFKDLGLLVIDEEHRFGVSAKEKLRQMKATVDTLTLTATPIPRTLQFSLMGARDLSIINTPPRNRLPIVTEIAQYDLPLIREAILKELHRGGQVYFIHDRIHDMDDIRTLLEENIPGARFHSAHGQMKGHELEKTMMDFLEKKFDVLLCTKIIESGIDIPSVNTIIINRADRFGLAELYQLRGRVGRSNMQAYAYLLTPPLSSLPRQTLRRLQAIQEFTELGSGFNLAMRDLEIRGAGNLLGGEQSGFIVEMGFEMYQRIVEEAVQELKEEEFSGLFAVEKKAKEKLQKPDTVIETDIEAFIPDVYVESDTERLDLYRRLYRMEALQDILAMRLEMQDRFGEYPPEVEHLFLLVELKLAAAALSIVKIELHESTLSLFFPPSDQREFYEGTDDAIAPFQRLMARVAELKEYQPHLKQEGRQLRLHARIPAFPEPGERLEAVRSFLTSLSPVEISPKSAAS